MTRELTSHKVNGMNELLRIDVLDEPGQGGACHLYGITSIESRNSDVPPAVMCPIRFQNGPIGEVGINGISGEALLAIILDRLECFHDGPYGWETNRRALIYVENALDELHSRTRDRMARDVEGTHEK